ncbi:pyridoxal kinase PdxY [uncultured Meiothermus sp.]|jgi:pyridoxine kinase|uniref:pyridoxal kinase PdxY n=1 Tax=uncultured Meiothermus sp. TaxID=157471 RepID=UPI00261B6747|nr:pyridoxal kinase PdxY [uncultured Meiothermus sp.]
MQPPRSILSLQSWVAYGHVGNAAAVFPLQRMGFEVWAIHTVQFSNHTGYGQWKGMMMPPEHLNAIVEGIAEREVLGQCDAVLSGYMGSGGTAEAILSALARVRQLNPRVLFCCDPVMGDEGRGLFVRPEIPEIIKNQVLPQADIITPNQFELELLTELSAKTLWEVLEAAQTVRTHIHPGGPRIVVVTSMLREGAPEGSIETLAVADQGAWLVRTPRIPLEPPRNGTGDAIAALFLGHYLQTGDVVLSLENAVSAMYNMLLLTHQLNTREIQLVAAQEEYVSPSRRFPAEKVG